jgi:signal transduction histidine kinase
MKRKLSRMSRRYASALRKHLKEGPQASLRPARGLGRQAVSLGLETLDVARIHQGALANLEVSSSRDGLIKRAEIFFAEAITPIEKTHHAALKAKVRLSRLSRKLSGRTADLAAANRSLKQGIIRRKTVEVALKKSGDHYQTLLKKSLALQKHLQHLTHQILSAQEDKRKKISHDLQDEIAQTLLGINVRLLTVKQAAGHNAKGLQQEIARTQRLVDRSVKTIERFTREYANPNEA